MLSHEGSFPLPPVEPVWGSLRTKTPEEGRPSLCRILLSLEAEPRLSRTLGVIRAGGTAGVGKRARRPPRGHCEWQGLSGHMLFPGPLPELRRPGLRSLILAHPPAPLPPGRALLGSPGLLLRGSTQEGRGGGAGVLSCAVLSTPVPVPSPVAVAGPCLP